MTLTPTLIKRVDTITPQIRGIQNALGTAGKRILLNQIGQRFLEITRQNFGPSGKYRGNDWKPYSKAYAKKIGSNSPTEERTGNLMNSIRVSSPRGNYIEVFTSNKYAAAQFLGNPKKKLPPRRFFPVESNGSNMWRLVLGAEREIVVRIGQILNIRSGGALPRLGASFNRSPFQFGNVRTGPS